MKTSPDTRILITLFAIAIRRISAQPCDPDYCDPTLGPQIRFPFRLSDGAADRICGYPGFDLRCDRNKTILRLPGSGDFVVDHIDYAAQALFVNDPGSCLLNFTLSGSPFSNYTFLNCSSDLQLVWSEPECWSCEKDGGFCGFMGETGFYISLDIDCYRLDKYGHLRGTKSGITIGVKITGIGIVCLLGLVCCLYGVAYCRRLNPTTFSPIIRSANGLDGPTIESYPMTVLGESRRSDGTCPICLSDYQPEESLKRIPECNHSFHEGCIDEWLKRNRTCPMCRRVQL